QKDDELDEGCGRPREVLEAGAAGQDVARAGDGERERREDDGECLGPARSHREAELLLGAEKQARRTPIRIHDRSPFRPWGGPVARKGSTAETGEHAALASPAAEAIGSPTATRWEPIGVSTAGQRRKRALAARIHFPLRWSATKATAPGGSSGTCASQ